MYADSSMTVYAIDALVIFCDLAPKPGKGMDFL